MGFQSFTVTVAEARDLMAKDEDTGTSDPYVELAYGTMECKTHIVYKTLNPKWNEVLYPILCFNACCRATICVPVFVS